MAPGEMIKQAREARGWTYDELGDRLGVSDEAVRKWENGERIPKRPNAQRIDKLLELGGALMDAYGFTNGNGTNLTEVQADVNRVRDALIDLQRSVEELRAVLERTLHAFVEGKTQVDRRLDALEGRAEGEGSGEG